MNLSILPATTDDLPMIINLFDRAIQYQKKNNYIGWQSMDKQFIENDVHQGLLYKICSGEKLVGIFCICFMDKLIWREKERGDAIYLHRIVLNREYQGLKMFKTVLHWAVEQARKKSLMYIRMDTWAANSKLIDYYKGYGFRFIENYTTLDTVDLPAQHRNLNVALLEFEIR